MRVIEVSCPECGKMKITFDEDIPPYEIRCPLCGNDVNIIKINGDEINDTI